MKSYDIFSFFSASALSFAASTSLFAVSSASSTCFCVFFANKNLPKKAPEFTDFLKKYRTSSALTAEALAYISENKASYDEAAVHFLKEHSELLDKWLPADKAKSVRSALGN